MNNSISSKDPQSMSNNTAEMMPQATSILVCQTVATALLMIASLLGNTLVICVVLQSLRMRTVTNYLIVNMACADMLYTLVAMPPLFVMIFKEYNWAMANRGRGIFFCQVVNFAQYVLVPVSILTLSAIAFDRFFAILMPIKRIINKCVFNWLLLAIWVVSIAVAAPMLYSLHITENDFGELSCEENWAPTFDNETAARIYTLVSFSVVFCLPLCIITVLYTIICRHLWFTKLPGETEREDSKNLSRHRKSRKKVVKMLIAVVVVFLISWLPLRVANFLYYYHNTIISEPLYFTCEFLMRASCALNPAVYAIFSENYRQGFKRVLVRCSCGSLQNFYAKRGSCSSSRHQTAPSFFRSEHGLSKRSVHKKSYQDTEDEEDHRC